jgi:hypothetical protein
MSIVLINWGGAADRRSLHGKEPRQHPNLGLTLASPADLRGNMPNSHTALASEISGTSLWQAAV